MDEIDKWNITMNKFLLFALMLSLGVLAYALGLFSKGSTTALSQYVPDSVGEMFSKTKNQQITALNTQQKNSDDSTGIATLILPDNAISRQAASTKQTKTNETKEAKELNTLKSNKEVLKDTLVEIPDTIITEIQQEISPEASSESLASVNQAVNEIESENQALKEKLISLNKQYNERDAVLEQLEIQIKDKLKSQKVLPNERDELLKELEKKIQSLNH